MHTLANRAGPMITIASYTLKGYIKERVLLVVLIFAFALMVASYVLAPLAVGAQRKVIIDVGLAAISFLGVLLVVLLGASSYSREKNHGILPALLAKPISRVDFILGKYVGTAATIALVMLVMAAVYIAVILLSNNGVSWKIVTAIYLSLLEVALITSVMTFFSSFSTPLLSSFFTGCVFIAGHLSKDLLAFAEQFGGIGLRVIASVGYYLLPNLSLFNIRSEAVHNLPLQNGFVYSVTVYGMFYILFLLMLSSLIFKHKDVT